MKSQIGNEIKEEMASKQVRIMVSPEGELVVSEMTDLVNEEFEAGRANRAEVASFMLCWFRDNAPDDVIFQLRRRLSNGLSMLDALAKKVKMSGELPEEIRHVLEQYYFGDGSPVARKAKNPLRKKSIIDKPSEGEAA